MVYHTTRAFILATTPYGERGRKIHLLSPDRGLLNVQAQGVIPAHSKLGGSLTPYRLLTVTLVSKAQDRVIGVEVDKTYARLWTDARRQGYAAWGNEWLMKILKVGVADERIFDACGAYYNALNNEEENKETTLHLSLYRLSFASIIIEALGYRLDIEGRRDDQGGKNDGRVINEEMGARAQRYKTKRANVFEAVERWTRQIGVETMKTSKFLTTAMK